MRPYLGVSLRVFRALNRAFSAPRICTVEAGCLARFRREPGSNRKDELTSGSHRCRLAGPVYTSSEEVVT